MRGDEARQLLGFPPNSRPTPSQVKAAYRSKAWDFHPDRFPVDKKSFAESKFKLISEAYTCLQSGARRAGSTRAMHAEVIVTGVPRSQFGRRNYALIKVPFLFITLGTIALGGVSASRAYRRERDAHPSHNPFLP